MEISEEIRRSIARILFEEWDPIGLKQLGVNKNQYERYAEGLINECRDDPSPSRISAYLGTVFFRIFDRKEEGLSSTTNAALLISEVLKSNHM